MNEFRMESYLPGGLKSLQKVIAGFKKKRIAGLPGETEVSC